MDVAPVRRAILGKDIEIEELLADNKVSDGNIRSSLIIDAIIGSTLVIAFCLLQRRSILYRFRLVSFPACIMFREHSNNGDTLPV